MHIVHDPNAPAAEPITFGDFLQVDIRIGTIREAAPLPKARNPSYILMIDFGPAIGFKKSAAQITVHYSPEELCGRQVLAVVNFPPRQIGPVQSQVLVLGCADADGAIVLAEVGDGVPNGARLA